MPHEVTRLLRLWREGDDDAARELAPILYPELRKLAAIHLRRERRGLPFQPTELVNEAYLRLMQQPHPLWESRGHFFSVASRLMRQVLVDHARQFQSSKRGSGQVEFQLDNDRAFSTVEALDLLRLDEAITELERMDVRKARIVEQHFFGGLTAGEIAELHKLSTITVRRDLRIAAAWLKSWLLQ